MPRDVFITEAFVQELLIGKINLEGYKVAKVEKGVSTDVFRLEKEGGVFFLRIFPQGKSVRAEVLAYQLLLEKGVHVPEVISYGDDMSELGRSHMIVKDIGGTDLEDQVKEGNEENLNSVLFSAGQDIAKMQQVPVSGFGKFKEGQPGKTEFSLEEGNYQDFVLKKFTDIMKKLEQNGILDQSQVAALKEKVIQNRELFSEGKPVLAHGDLDLSHIFSDGDRYTGMIDFGNLQGASPYYDFAYFRLRCGAEYTKKLLAGYESLQPLPPDVDSRIQLEGLIIALQKLAWSYSKGENHPRFLKAKKVLKEHLDSMTI